MATVYLALGSNQGKPVDNLRNAIKSLSPAVSMLKTAPFYRSRAVGFTEQPDFVNTAVSGTTDLSPIDLLKFLKETEQKVGRIERFRWGPREIDIDIILYDDQIVQTEALTIPHPEFSNRDFVLQPLFDLNPDAADPRSGLSIRQLLENLPDERRSGLKKIDVIRD